MPTFAEQYSLDANVILRYILVDHITLSAQAARFIAKLEEGEITAQLDPINLGEVVFVMTKQYKIPAEEISENLIPLLRCPYLIIPNKERYITALRLYGSGVRHFGDACTCACALEECHGRLFSFDRELGKIPGINRVDTL